MRNCGRQFSSEKGEGCLKRMRLLGPRVVGIQQYQIFSLQKFKVLEVNVKFKSVAPKLSKKNVHTLKCFNT